MKISLNPNRKQRKIGFFFLTIYLSIIIFYLFFDGWHFEWLAYGYDGANQHFDLNIFSDMDWELVNGVPVYNSTNNLHNLIYMCLWTGILSAFALVTGNKWLRQGAVGTMAFPVISTFSTINPFIASDILTFDIFRYHFYILQIVYDINHLSGIILGVYNFHLLIKDKEEINFKKITPIIMFTWLLFILSRFLLQKWPFWDPANRIGMISTNQINNMPFFLYGFEYIIVVALLYFINVVVKFSIPKIQNHKMKLIFPFLVFAGFTIIFVMIGLIVLQEIPGSAFIQS